MASERDGDWIHREGVLLSHTLLICHVVSHGIDKPLLQSSYKDDQVDGRYMQEGQ